MTPTRTALVGAVLVLVAILAVRRSTAARRPTIAAVDARFRTERAARDSSSALAEVSGRLATGALGGWVDRSLGIALSLAATTVPAVIARMLTVGAVWLLAMLLAIGGTISIGLLPATPFWLVVVVLIPVAMAGNVLGEVRSVARRRRRELNRVANDFVQLVAVALTTNRSIEESISFAAQAGEGPGFELLRETVRTARPMGIPIWEALGTMADTYGLDDLRGLTGALRRQAGVGVSVAETVRTEAAAMRARQLDDLTDQADKANANLSIPTMGMVIGMVVFLGFPIAQRISSAF